MTPVDRIMARVERVTESGCWVFMGGLTTGGYSHIGVRVAPRQRKQLQGHRVTYEHFRGPIPAGHELDHLCRVKCCVNPAHLQPVLHRENVLRGAGKAADNARKTHCPKGHLYSEHGFIHHKRKRQCRACKRAWRPRVALVVP